MNIIESIKSPSQKLGKETADTIYPTSKIDTLLTVGVEALIGVYGIGVGVGTNTAIGRAGTMIKVTNKGIQGSADFVTAGNWGVKAGVTFDLINW